MRGARLASSCCVALAVACGGGSSPAPGGGGPGGDPGGPPPAFEPIVDLRADVNRDGVADLADPADDAGEEGWTPGAGAILLANLDDDLGLCGASMVDGPEFADDAMAACNDAADDVVNGPDDALDLAPLRTAPWPGAPADAVGALVVDAASAPRVRIFRRSAGEHVVLPPGAELGPADLRAGLDLGIEARDVVRDPAVWDGRVDVTFRVWRRGAPQTAVEDRIRLKVAPVILTHPLLRARTLVASDVAGKDADLSLALRTALAGVGERAGLTDPLRGLATLNDRWMQDFFEDGYAAMPAPGGAQVMRVLLRSPFVQLPDAPYSPLRQASRVVYFLRGRDVAVVQQYQRDRPLEMRTLDSMGNTEVVPPHTARGVAYPSGRILRGRTASFYPDPSFTRLLEAQGAQPPIYLDTSWLFVGHVDETLSFVASARAPRGFVALVADPPLARSMLEGLAAAGHGDATLFTGLTDSRGNPAARTISQVLADADVAAASAIAAERIAAQLDVLRAEVELADEEIVRVPVLFRTWTTGRLAAFLTNTVNLLAPAPGLVAAPEPHGPVVDGADPFRAHLEDALAPHGVSVAWVDAWSYLHVYVGELHCGSNTLRELPALPWWAAGAGGS